MNKRIKKKQKKFLYKQIKIAKMNLSKDDVIVYMYNPQINLELSKVFFDTVKNTFTNNKVIGLPLGTRITKYSKETTVKQLESLIEFLQNS